jgi:Reverse transcriptase (RNA-dependent DNA polymerase)
VLNSIIFIKQKRCGRIKARACADGRPQRALYEKSEASSPTVKTESVILTSVIDAAEERVIGVYDIPGAFLHSKLPDTVYMKVTGTLTRFLVAVAPDIYSSFVVTENGIDVIYLLLTRALYGCLKSALQFWKHLSGNLVKRGYTLNPYDSCVANKMIGGSQFTIVWHVDDLKLSHISETVMDEEVKWLESIYGPLVGSKGNQHTYLGMDLDFDNRKLKVTMIPYLQEIIDEFPDEIGKASSTPAALHLFDESDDPVPLSAEKSKIFHHTVAKVLWAAIRARPDLLTTLSYLTCKVKNPDEDDYKKLKRMLSYIRETITLPLVLSADGTRVIKWWVDASFAVRKEMRSQTGATMSLGSGGIYSMSRKQKLNTTSSTEAELVAADDIMPQMIWTRNFLMSQGVKVTHNILYQDNRSAMLLEKNGTVSSSRRTRHINVRFFFIKDRITAEELELQYCPTDQMIGDYFTKPLQGKKFFFFRKIIMGEEEV